MLNKVELMGRMVATPELKHTNSGIVVTSFTIACKRMYKSGEDGEVDFIDCVAWRKTAEFICRNFRKGQMAVLVGTLQPRFYEDRNGNSKKVVEVIVGECYFGGDSSPKREPENIPPTDAEVEYIPIVSDDDDLPF